MCHHLGDEDAEKWVDEHEREEDPERGTPDEPAFANEESEVDVELLDADD